jgi:ribonuclease III
LFKKILSWLFRKRKLSNEELRNLISQNLKILESRIGFQIHNKAYYIKALTHRSYLELYPELKKSNERLEFLGDSVLNMLVGQFLFETYENEGEGFLTKARAALVNRNRLAKTAEELNLEKFLMYNHKYLRDSIDGLQTILADATEALIGAIYLDKGLEQAKKFVDRWVIEPYEEGEKFLIDTNFKGQLLELAHANKLESPKYILKNVEGPDHKKEFTVDVFIGDKYLGTGKGKSKKIAEQNASQQALEFLKEE